METFDFIVVGSGPAGSLLAARLASTPSKPTVLLLEAGGPQPSKELLAMSNRWTTHGTQSEINWGYETTPQSGLNGRSVEVSRGKALGGTSNINFLCWTPPNKGYIDEWRSRVGGDSFFGWQESQRLMDGIVKYKTRSLPSDSSDLLNDTTRHPVTDFVAKVEGANGSFDVEYNPYLKKADIKILNGVTNYGFRTNSNMNDGNSLGFGIMPSMSTDGSVRSTPSAAFLADAPENLVIKTGREATRVVFEGKTASVVEVNGGEESFRAAKCIVLSAGAINTPKLLMLSGVGPADHLHKHSIPLVADLPGVGQHLSDHWAHRFMWQMDENFNGKPVVPSVIPYPNQDMFNCVAGFDRDETILVHSGFSNLPQKEQEFLSRADTPTLEIIHVPNFPLGPPALQSNLVTVGVHLTPQARGSVTLASANWRDAPHIDPNLLGDEGGLDIASAVTYARKIIDLVENTESISQHIVTPLATPKSDSEADIISFTRETTSTMWHPSCTARMGPGEDESDDSVVDPFFKVRGLENLRIADLSVTPLIPNFHPVSMALLVGAWAAERMITEFDL